MNGEAEVRVIVVDDEADVRELLAEWLSLNGYRVATAAEGTMALSLAEGFSPHCVILDVRMPGMSGLDLAHHLRERHGDDVVIIAITGAIGPELESTQASHLVDHYYAKPFDLGLLAKILPPLTV